MTCKPAPTANASKPSRMSSATSAITTLTRSGTASPSASRAPGFFLWYSLVTVVPCLLGSSLVDAQHLPHGRRQAGDRHLKFHETRDNLRQSDRLDPLESVIGQTLIARSLARPGRLFGSAVGRVCSCSQ